MRTYKAKVRRLVIDYAIITVEVEDGCDLKQTILEEAYESEFEVEDGEIRYEIDMVQEITEVVDLFETPELIPPNVLSILETFDDNGDEYKELVRIVDEIEPLGYTFDYYLDAVPFGLRKIKDSLEVNL